MTRKRSSLILAFLFALVVTACGGPSTPPPRSTALPTLPPVTGIAPTAIQPTAGGGTSGGNTLAWLSIYFTNPNPPDVLTGSVDQPVIAAINAARQTIDVASFDFTLPSVSDALIAAKQRGVRVRIIMDDKNGAQELNQPDLVAQIGGQPFEKIKASGIPLIGGGRSNGLMHNKMLIIDSTTLFVGSWNLSYNDTYRNNNNLLQITNQKLIENYQAKFNEGFERGLFGTKALLNSPNPVITINSIRVEQYFSPDDNVMARLVAEVNNAQQSIKFLAFTYTHKDLSSAMIARFRAGVNVQGVIENRGASQGALVPLFCAKVPVLTDGNNFTMHHKVIIIDDTTVITGSFNFTVSADTSNDDNVIIIRSKSVANAFLREYAKLYGQGKMPDATGIDCSKTQ